MAAPAIVDGDGPTNPAGPLLVDEWQLLALPLAPQHRDRPVVVEAIPFAHRNPGIVDVDREAQARLRRVVEIYHGAVFDVVEQGFEAGAAGPEAGADQSAELVDGPGGDDPAVGESPGTAFAIGQGDHGAGSLEGDHARVVEGERHSAKPRSNLFGGQQGADMPPRRLDKGDGHDGRLAVGADPVSGAACDVAKAVDRARMGGHLRVEANDLGEFAGRMAETARHQRGVLGDAHHLAQLVDGQRKPEGLRIGLIEGGNLLEPQEGWLCPEHRARSSDHHHGGNMTKMDH